MSVRVNFILPDDVYNSFKTVIPKRQRSKIVAALIQQEIARRENKLYEIAKAVEENLVLKEDMAAWDVTTHDGLEDSPWK